MDHCKNIANDSSITLHLADYRTAQSTILKVALLLTVKKGTLTWLKALF